MAAALLVQAGRDAAQGARHARDEDVRLECEAGVAAVVLAAQVNTMPHMMRAHLTVGGRRRPPGRGGAVAVSGEV